MWWRSNAFLMLLLLTACGFTPLYDNSEGAALAPIQTIEIDPIPKRSGQVLKIALEDRLNPQSAGTPRYRLSAGLETALIPAVIEPDGNITRYNITLTSPFRLIRKSDGKELYVSTMKRIVSYNVPEQDFSTFVAQNDAMENGIVELAEDYRLRLGAWFAEHPEVP